MIGATTQGLFRDTFGQGDLFRGLPAITRRVVAWGPGSDVLTLPHSAVIAGEQDLLERVPPPTECAGTTDADWTIVASRPIPEGCSEQHFGSRTARAVPVRLRDDADRLACCVESMESGWLFLIPCANDGGWLLEVGAPGEMLLPGSRLVSRQIAETAGEPVVFPAYPRIAWPLCGPGWLACGAGCPVLRSAVRRRKRKRNPGGHSGCRRPARDSARGRRGRLLAHYRWRLLAGFQRHLEVCEGFYQSSEAPRPGGGRNTSQCAPVGNGAPGNLPALQSGGTASRVRSGGDIGFTARVSLFVLVEPPCDIGSGAGEQLPASLMFST